MGLADPILGGVRYRDSGLDLTVIPKKIECRYPDLEETVLPLLRGQIFHVTNEETFNTICRSGWISGKEQGQFVFTPVAENSYGRKRGWVSLFDLRETPDAHIKEALIRYWFLRTFHNESTHVYLFVTESAWSSLISWKRATREVGATEFFIPFVEAWYPGDIPLCLIGHSLAVTVRTA
jgi:hypothetical protein